MTATSGKAASAGERGRRAGGRQARHNGMPNIENSSGAVPTAYQQSALNQPKRLCDFVYIVCGKNER